MKPAATSANAARWRFMRISFKSYRLYNAKSGRVLAADWETRKDSGLAPSDDFVSHRDFALAILGNRVAPEGFLDRLQKALHRAHLVADGGDAERDELHIVMAGHFRDRHRKL